MNKEFKLLASIVVCSYNGQKNIRRCIESLLNQKVNNKLYEIILVDDGSSDGTSKIVSDLPIRIIKHKQNYGIARSRNTGLKFAKGEIYICFDDDCIADKNWLSEILKTYNRDTIGVCGYTKNSTKGLVDLYLAAIGHGNPTMLIDGVDNNVLIRFKKYIIDMINRPNNRLSSNIYQVKEIWGENSSFKYNTLIGVKGWDNNLNGIEDTDICDRINNKYNLPFLCNPKAVIYHDGNLSLIKMLLKPIKRGDYILRFYLKINKVPPFFPFPLFITGIFIIALFKFGIISIFVIFLLIPLAYFWWTISFFRTYKKYYILFAYFQFLTECSYVLGILFAYSKLIRQKKYGVN